jgi:hypothetical protein
MYTSDFTSGVDNWAASSVQGTLTLTANQTAPGSGEAGWLKGTFDTNQDNQAGIKNTALFGGNILMKIGGYHELSMKIYLDNPSASTGDYWGGADDVGTFGLINGRGLSPTPQVPQEEVFNLSEKSSNFTSETTNQTGDIYWISAGDRPAANAVFYIKDIVWKVYGY